MRKLSTTTIALLSCIALLAVALAVTYIQHTVNNTVEVYSTRDISFADKTTYETIDAITWQPFRKGTISTQTNTSGIVYVVDSTETVVKVALSVASVPTGFTCSITWKYGEEATYQSYVNPIWLNEADSNGHPDYNGYDYIDIKIELTYDGIALEGNYAFQVIFSSVS